MYWQLGFWKKCGKMILEQLNVCSYSIRLNSTCASFYCCVRGIFLPCRKPLIFTSQNGPWNSPLSAGVSFLEVDYSTCGFSWLFAFPSRILKTRLRIFSCSFEFSSACWFSYLFSASGFYSDTAGALTLLAKMKIFCRFQASALLPWDSQKRSFFTSGDNWIIIRIIWDAI